MKEKWVVIAINAAGQFKPEGVFDTQDDALICVANIKGTRGIVYAYEVPVKHYGKKSNE